jgi:hypothetical protein
MSDSTGTAGPAADVDPLTVFDPAKREPDLRAMTRIVLQPIGSPMPLGFFTVAIDSVLVSALQWGILPAADRRAVALIVFPAFVVQVILCRVRRLRRLHAGQRASQARAGRGAGGGRPAVPDRRPR